MLLGILLGFIIPVGLFLYWILVLTVIASARYHKTVDKFEEDL